jgi:trehalose synthase
MTAPPPGTGSAVEHGVTLVETDAAHSAGPAWGHDVTEPASALADRLGVARIWHVSSTATGGGVAELLWSSIAAQRSLGLPVNWLVADADPAFFQLTKRLHHGLHGHYTEELGPEDEQRYRAATARSARQLADHISPGDVVLLHDPQTAGIAPDLLDAGVRVAWRCHIGTRTDGPTVVATWEFLRPYIEPVPNCVFTALEFAPTYLLPARTSVITPSIEPSSAKNRALSEQHCRDLLTGIGLLAPLHGLGQERPTMSSTIQDRYLPLDVPVVTQVSRWDPLKDMTGVLRAFADRVAPRSAAHLLLAGPDPADIPDDPEGARVFGEVRRIRDALPAQVRDRVHLFVLTLRDRTANGLIINAVQRFSTIVVQKSIEEGFGLTVTEAMWKARPIVASAVGGLLTQLTDRVDSLLVDPLDHAGFGDAVNELLARPDYAAGLGRAAHERCRTEFLAERELRDYLRLYARMLDE